MCRARSASPGSGGYGRWVAQAFGVLIDHHFRSVEASIDGGPTRQAAMVVVQNTLSYGGLFTLSPQARLDSGQLEVVWVHANTMRDLVRLLAHAGFQRMHHDKQVKIERGTHVKIRARHPTAVQADGDPAGTTDIDIRLLPDAMQLLRAPQP